MTKGMLPAAQLPDTWIWGIALMVVALTTCGAAHAAADGPDFLRVTGVRDGSTLNVRSGPGLDDPRIGSLPFDADGIRNLGCEGDLTLAEWQQATPAEREAARYRRWCHIEHGATVGWAAGWYLAEGSAPEPTTGSPTDLVGVRWRLVSSPAGPALGEAWIEFAEDGAAHGSLGCNSFRGTAEIAAGTLRMSPLATTRMHCLESERNAQERAIAAVLSTPLLWEIQDDQLLLVGAGEGQELVLTSG